MHVYLSFNILSYGLSSPRSFRLFLDLIPVVVVVAGRRLRAAADPRGNDDGGVVTLYCLGSPANLGLEMKQKLTLTLYAGRLRVQF